MENIPIDIWRIIFSFDSTFHETFQTVLDDLMNNFFQATRHPNSFSMRFRNYGFLKEEIRIKMLLSPIIEVCKDANIDKKFQEAMKKYVHVRCEESVKQYWFEKIKLFTPSDFSFSQHVFILDRFIQSHNHRMIDKA